MARRPWRWPGDQAWCAFPGAWLEELAYGKALSELEAAVSTYSARFEAGALAPSELGPALRSGGRIEKLASALCSMLAARMAAGAGAGGAGEAGAALARAAERQAERELASAAGTSLEAAGRAIDVGRALAQQPDLDAAARGGVLSRRQAAPISDASALDSAAGPCTRPEGCAGTPTLWHFPRPRPGHGRGWSRVAGRFAAANRPSLSGRPQTGPAGAAGGLLRTEGPPALLAYFHRK